MSDPINAEQFVEKLKTYQSDEELRKYHRYFKFDENETGDGDVFMGVRMGQVFELAKEFITMPLDEVEKLLESPIHEVRVGGVSIMDFQARSKKTPDNHKQELYALYLRRHDRINHWDLVDRAAPYVVGGYLLDKPRAILYRLARSNNLWERRTAIVSTARFIREGDVADTFALAEMLLDDKEDLVHKATGWMLRAAGEAERPKLRNFLDQHAATMPRTLLRYAIENFEPEERTHYLSLKKK